MKEIKITLACLRCTSTNIVKNGTKSYKNKQNYLCKGCSRQFISDYYLDYKSCHSSVNQRIKNMFIRGLGVRDIAVLEEISFKKILSVLVNCCTILSCKQTYYNCLEIDEFWSFVGNKTNKVWLIYAYHRETGNNEVALKVNSGLDFWKKRYQNCKKIIQNNERKRH